MTTQRGVDTSRRGVRGGSRGVNDDLAALIAAVGRPTAKQNNAALLGAAVSIAESAKIREAQEARQAGLTDVLSNFSGLLDPGWMLKGGDPRPDPYMPGAPRDIRDRALLGGGIDPQPTEGLVNKFLEQIFGFPGVSQTIGALQEHVLTPGANIAWGGVQATLEDLGIEGDYELLRQREAVREAAMAEGTGFLGGRLAGMGGTGAEAPMPSGTVSLPFELGLPSALFGPGKTLKDIKVGVRGGLELGVGLPFDVLGGGLAGLAGKAALRGGRAILPTKAIPLPKTAMMPERFGFENLTPGTPKWIQYAKTHPTHVEQMGTYASRLRQGLEPQATKVLRTSLDTYLDSFYKVAPTPRGPLKTVITTVYRKTQELMSDKLAKSNAATSRGMRQHLDELGEEMPEWMQFELQASTLPGAGAAGRTYGSEAVTNARRALGSGIDERLIDAFLATKHQLDILVNHPERLVPMGMRSVADLRSQLQQMAVRHGPENFARIESAAGVIRDFYRAQLQRKVDEGLVSRELQTLLNERFPWYNRVGYLDNLMKEIESPIDLTNPGRGLITSVTTAGIRSLSQSGTESAMKSPMRSVVDAAMATEMLIRRNQAARALYETLVWDPETTVRRISGARPVAVVDEKAVFRRPGGEIPGTISYMAAGKRVVIEVPKWAEDMAKHLADMGGPDWLRHARTALTPMRAALITYDPVFVGVNAIRDVMTAWSSYGVWPWESVRAAMTTLRAMVKGPSGEFLDFIRGGGDVSGYFGRSANEWKHLAGKIGNITLEDDAGWAKYFSRPWETIRDVGHALEMAPRLAASKRAYRDGASRLKATQIGRRTNVDFARSGTAIQWMNSFFLFLNPAVQGALLPGRALRDYPRARYFTAGMYGAKTAEYMWNRQFEEYFDRPAWDRLGRFSIHVPSHEIDEYGNTVPHHFTLPPMHEYSAMMIPWELFLHALDGKDPVTFNEVLKVMENFNPLSPVTDAPIPTALKPFTEYAFNYDTFRGRPIVPKELQGLPNEQQFDENTSDVARRVGALVNQSPMKIDHLLKFGVMRDVIAGADNVLRLFSGDADPQAEAIVVALQELIEDYEPHEAALHRRAVLNSIPDADLRKRVEDLERAPEGQIPVVSRLQDRFMRKTNGQIFRSGFNRAAGRAGINADFLRELQNQLGVLDDSMYVEEVSLDAEHAKGAISGGDWVAGYRLKASFYEMFLTAEGTPFPRERAMLVDREARAAFYDDVHTLSGSVEDRRTRGQLLVAGLEAIPIPTESVVEGIEMLDWGLWFDLRDEYRDSFSTEDLSLLQSEREAGMTPARREYDQRREATRPYYDVHKQILLNHPERIALYEDFRRSVGSERTLALLKNPLFAEVEKQEKDRRILMRTLDPELDAFLFSFNDSIAHTLHPDNLGLVREMELRPHMRVLLENNPELFGNLVQ